MTDESHGKWSSHISLTSTVKEGYRVGGASVTYTDLDGLSGDMPRHEIRKRLYELVKDGERIADKLNNEKPESGI